MALHARYEWRNSGHPAISYPHSVWDTKARRSYPLVVSDSGGLTVAYAGISDGIRYVLDFIDLRREASGRSPATRREGRVSARSLRRGMPEVNADIVIVGAGARDAHRLSPSASVVLPMRVHLVLDTGSGAEVIRAGVSRRERWQFSRDQRRNEWCWVRADRTSLFDYFYERMYLPTMLRRHGPHARLEDRESSFECLYRQGHLFFLCGRNGPIGGALCHWNRPARRLTLRLLGVLDGAQEHYSSGAFKAIYHHLTYWAADHDPVQLDFQATEPFLSKGTFQWKRRMGAAVAIPPTHFLRKRLWLQVRADTSAVRDFLVSNPMITETGGTLKAVYFHDSYRPPRLDLSAKSPGIERVSSVDLDAFLAASSLARQRAGSS